MKTNINDVAICAGMHVITTLLDNHKYEMECHCVRQIVVVLIVYMHGHSSGSSIQYYSIGKK